MICSRCPRQLIQQRAWYKLTTDQRDAWRASGGDVLHGRGLCRACHKRARVAGTLHLEPLSDQATRRPVRIPQPPRAETRIQPHACTRCGITTRQPDMCRDCNDVLTPA